MPRHENPRDIRLKLSVDNTTTRPVPRPNSSPIALRGIDLSSIEGSFPLSSLPPLPASPPPHGSSPPFGDPAKSTIDGALTRLDSREDPDRPDDSGPAHTRQHLRDEDEALRPSSSSMSKIYHLRKAPGSTPELSLVGTADNVAKTPLEGECATCTISAQNTQRSAALQHCGGWSALLVRMRCTGRASVMFH